MASMTGVSKAATSSLALALTFWAATMLLPAAAAPAPAKANKPANLPPQSAALQPRPVTGFITSYEILRRVRAAGLHPLGLPLRDASTYALRAADFRGNLVQVMLDARTGAIRDVVRIAPSVAGPTGIVEAPYEPPPYGPPLHRTPAGYESPAAVVQPEIGGGTRPPSAAPAAFDHPRARPRPRPARRRHATLAASKHKLR